MPHSFCEPPLEVLDNQEPFSGSAFRANCTTTLYDTRFGRERRRPAGSFTALPPIHQLLFGYSAPVHSLQATAGCMYATDFTDLYL